VVFVVERYLPGLDQERLVGLLGNLGRATQELRDEGTAVRYLGSTIVPGDEACFCQFDGASEAAVAEANERAGVPFDRIVAAVAVPVTEDGS
jgi:Nickel responsive protein SCO4226-like